MANIDTQNVLKKNKVVAVVGLSDKPERPSNEVALYLKSKGFSIIPINPMVTEVFGEKAYPSVSSVPDSIHVDIVDIFRKPEAVISVVEDVIESGRKPIVWLQEGVSSIEAEEFLKENNFEFVSNICMMKEHKKI